ncbi:flagellar motor switch protein FliN [Acutalibacter muris]|uniref:Flagellar motor switch phosphatase FliY n=1 Tax=Acutalibacter muris TaxID=1796620 RepID=A0A1Z2XSW4_9FIRM|nr:flagellar motor switch protein FliN [Acutalibacter muris]ANU55212.1 flagellar motor switch protein FliN [Hungateiclostridiaceae bacterium KB18]ASB41552.1 flagellar motor switch phosphatase FliY [Acutalibacter muris]QQR30813.1 flagellar motor switch protein FliN [Acutalibacter muris]
MSNDVFKPMEISAIGEIMNISLGSSATAVSNLLDHRVDITTPTVTVVDVKDFELGDIEPAVGVEIKYVSGLDGSNLMLLRMNDIKVIVDILMGTDTPLEEFELDELSLSAVCEVMNQMMGAASTALSDFLGRVVNISTPETFDVYDQEAMKRDRMPVQEGPIVVVRFALSIEDQLQSEFMNVISVDLAKELVRGFGLEDDEPEPAPMPAPAPAPAPSESGGVMSQEEIEKLMAGGAAAPAPAAPAPAPAPSAGGGVMSQEEIEKLLAGGGAAAPAPAAPAVQPPAAPAQQPVAAQPGAQAQMPMMPPMMPMQEGQQAYPGYPYYPPYPGYPYYPPQPPEPKVIATTSPSMPRLENGEELTQEQNQNLDLIMGVPLEVTVEIGRTRKRVQEILSFSKGSLVVLDKLAGDQVDLFVNGKCIARGDVVVIDDNFGIRVTEIIKRPDIEDITGK